MVDAMDPDCLGLVVNPVEHPVGAKACAVLACELAAKRLADASWLARRVAEAGRNPAKAHVTYLRRPDEKPHGVGKG